MPWCKKCKTLFGRNIVRERKQHTCNSCKNKSNKERIKKLKENWKNRNGV